MDQPLWQPSEERIERANMTAFARQVAAAHGERLRDYAELRAWSVERPELFWPALWRYAEVRASRPWQRRAGRWRADARRQLVRRRGAQFRREPAAPPRRPARDHRLDRGRAAARAELPRAVPGGGEARRGAAARGRRPGRPGGGGDAARGRDHRRHARDHRARRDLVVVLARLRRPGGARPLRPDRAQGADHDRRLPLQRQADRRARQARRDRGPPARPASAWSWRRSSSRRPRPARSAARSCTTTSWCTDPGPIPFAQLPFDHPIYILYSSGTTGVPKAIVHGAGGTLLQHLKELLLHTDLKPEDRIFYFTTCGWMMWNWQVSALATGATLVLYDGSPFHPDGNRLFDLAQAEAGHRLRHQRQVHRRGQEGRARAGQDARSERAARDSLDRLAAGARELRLRLPQHQGGPAPRLDLRRHRHHVAASRSAIRSRRCGAASCRPAASAWRSRCGTSGARPVVGEPGELVCVKPFPSMPVGFLERSRRQPLPRRLFRALPRRVDARRPRRADRARRPDHLRPLGCRAQSRRRAHRHRRDLPSGRADPRGARSARGRPGVGRRSRAWCCSCAWPRARPSTTRWSERIRRQIRTNCTPRHVPAKILPVADIPRTMNNKIAELAVREAIHGRPVRNVDALANPAVAWSCTAISTSSRPESLPRSARRRRCRRAAC